MALLRSKGYDIVATNWSCKAGEIDIVAKDGAELIFVEVRSRASDEHGDAAETVGHHKQRQVVRVARHYIAQEAPVFETSRFDVVAVTAGQVEHLIDAFRA